MTVFLYSNRSPRNFIHKDLPIQGPTLNGVLRKGTSVTDPVIEIESTVDIPDKLYNYAYIPKFERYYYITNIRLEHEKLWSISMHVDVLMSHWEGIKDSLALASRSSSQYQMALDDPKLVFEQEPDHLAFNFPQQPFTANLDDLTKQYVLIVAGHY